MTGIDRLRKVSEQARKRGCPIEHCPDVPCKDCWGIMLADIADQIERERACDEDAIENVRLIVGRVIDDMERHVSGVEGADDSPVARWVRELREALGGDGCDHAADVSMSAYDLLPQEEREAIAWVREHDGLDSVKKLLDWVVGHCSTRQQLDFDFWLSGRVMHELGFEEDMADRDEVERRLLARLMPEGMEWLLEVWPKWSDGEYCKFGDWWRSDMYGESEPRQFRKLSIYTPEQLREWGQDDGDNYGYEWDFVRPSDPKYRPDKVEPPAPKVIDADGAEIRVGDTVWDVESGIEYEVVGIHTDEDTPVRVMRTDGSHLAKAAKPSTLTHRAPVLAADGRPLREGETVWDTNGDELVIGALEDGGHTVTCRYVDVGDAIPAHGMWSPSDLTHERPDSWERLEEDAANLDEMPCDYSAKDLVRRAKKLAERGQ